MTLNLCTTGMHSHQPSPVAGRCAFPDRRRANGLCGREPVALYVNPYAKVLNTYRCASHDQAVVVEAAQRDGFRRVALDTKAARIDALEKLEAAA